VAAPVPAEAAGVAERDSCRRRRRSELLSDCVQMPQLSPAEDCLLPSVRLSVRRASAAFTAVTAASAVSAAARR